MSSVVYYNTVLIRKLSVYEKMHLFITFYIHFKNQTNHTTYLNCVLYTKELRSNEKKPRNKPQGGIIDKSLVMVADTGHD